MAEEKKKDKKLIIDEDWKSEAQKEKDVLAEQEKQEKAEKADQKQRPPLPKGDFAALISMLTTQAFFALGAIQMEGHDQKEPDLEMAKYNIDMLETLEQKCKGNLSEQEQRVLTDTLSQVRMAYVKLAG